MGGMRLISVIVLVNLLVLLVMNLFVILKNFK